MRIIEQVQEIMDRHPELRCTACNGTGRVEPSETLKFVCTVAYGRTFGKVRCLACFGSGYVPPEDRIQ
jgi:hypothetical protein